MSREWVLAQSHFSVIGTFQVIAYKVLFVGILLMDRNLKQM